MRPLEASRPLPRPHGADGHRRVDDRGENPCSCRAVPNGSHQIAQRQETRGKCACADGCNRADRPTVNPAGCSRTDGEGDAVYGCQESDRRHSGSTDLDDDARNVWQHGVSDVADKADRGRADEKARRLPRRSVAAVNANDPPAAGRRSPPPSATSSDSSARASAIRTSPQGFSSHRAQCTPTSPTSTPSSGSLRECSSHKKQRATPERSRALPYPRQPVEQTAPFAQRRAVRDRAAHSAPRQMPAV